jgi:ribonuclease HI
MDLATPHFLLFSHIDRSGRSGSWQFVLRSKDGGSRFEAADAETDIPVERLDLLTVVRALESLDQPSRVTLVDCSDYVWSGVRYGLADWRSNGWQWEYFGQMVPVKNSDLWQRLDRALEFHDVECRRRRFDGPHEHQSQPYSNRLPSPDHAGPASGCPGARRGAGGEGGVRQRFADWLKYATWAIPRTFGRRPAARVPRGAAAHRL